MPDDRFTSTPPLPEPDLGEALRALPLQPPKRSAWAELERELAASASVAAVTPAPRRRRSAWLALAATFAAAVIGVRLYPAATDGLPVDNAPAVVEPSGESADTRALIAESQRLDAALATLDARSVPLDAGTAMASAELENLIGLTDLQLNATTRDDEARALWTRRVDLMNRLASTRLNARFDALSDNGGAYLQDASYRID